MTNDATNDATSRGTAIESWTEDEGRLLRVRLAGPPRNVLDRTAVELLIDALSSAGRGTAAVLIDHAGPSFSLGTSIEDHRPAEIARALPRFHELFRVLVDLPAPVACAASGYCLGGGFELALAADVLFIDQSTELGLPEIRLGAFAPVGSLLLGARVGEGRARDLLLTGRRIGAGEAVVMGLSTGGSPGPRGSASDTALHWLRRRWLPLSASSLGFAARAARHRGRAAFLAGLDELERLYLQELATTRDAAEGVEAFLDKRPPRWNDG